MKPTNKYPTSLAGQKIKNTAALLVVALVFTGCFQHYFRTNTQVKADPIMLDSLRNSNKYFIVHYSDSSVVGLNNISVANDRIEGNMVALPVAHGQYLHPVTEVTNRVKKRDKATTLTEVHLYTVNLPNDINRLSLPLSSFSRVDVYTFDAKKTKSNHIFSGVGIGTTVAVMAVVIAMGSAPDFR
jgi:hypothetical protein